MLFAVLLLVVIGFYTFVMLVTGAKLSRKNYYVFACLLIIGFGWLAFYFEPSRAGGASFWDIAVYRIEIASISQYSFKEVLNRATTITEPLRFILWYLLGLLPSLNSFQTVSVVVACGTVFYCSLVNRNFCYAEGVIESAKNYRFPILIVVMSYLSLFAMIDYLEMINTGRFIIAGMLVIIGVKLTYLDRRRLLGCLLILAAALLHTAMWMVLLLVLINDLFIKFEKAKIILLMWRFFPFLIAYVLRLIPLDLFGFNLSGEIADMLIQAAAFQPLTFNRFIYASTCATFSICAYYFINQKKAAVKGKDQNNQYMKVLDLIQLFLLLVIGGLETNIAFRMQYFGALMSPFYLYDNKAVKDSLRRCNLPTLFYILSCLVLIVYEFALGMTLMERSGAHFG